MPVRRGSILVGFDNTPFAASGEVAAATSFKPVDETD
jgi:hypothetical protein